MLDGGGGRKGDDCGVCAISEGSNRAVCAPGVDGAGCVSSKVESAALGSRVVSTAVEVTSCRRASYGEGYSAIADAGVDAGKPWAARCLLFGRGVEDFEGESVMLDISRSAIESVEMC